MGGEKWPGYEVKCILTIFISIVSRARNSKGSITSIDDFSLSGRKWKRGVKGEEGGKREEGGGKEVGRKEGGRKGGGRNGGGRKGGGREEGRENRGVEGRQT